MAGSDGLDALADGPDEPAEFSGDRNDDLVAIEAARSQAPKASAQAQLRLPGQIGGALGQSGLPPCDHPGDTRRVRVCQAASMSARRAELLPALVMTPWRCRLPEESSLGIIPRYPMSLRGETKRVRSPSSATILTAWMAEMPRTYQRPPAPVFQLRADRLS